MSRTAGATDVSSVITWAEARRLYESPEGYTLREIAALKAVTPQCVQQRAAREAWLRPREQREVLAALGALEFVKRDPEVIAANLAEKHDVNREIMALVRHYVNELQQGRPVKLTRVKALRELSVTLKNVESIDACIAGLREFAGVDGDGDKSTPGGRTPEQINELLASVREAQRKREAEGATH